MLSMTLHPPLPTLMATDAMSSNAPAVVANILAGEILIRRIKHRQGTWFDMQRPAGVMNVG